VNFGNGPRRFNRTLMTAYSLLILASLSQRVLIKDWGVSGNLADAITGLLYGATIGLFILGIRQMMQGPRGPVCRTKQA
jgi:hypothetical protein